MLSGVFALESITITFGVPHYHDKKCRAGRAAPTKAREKEKGRRKSRTGGHPSSGQLQRETDLPSGGSLSRNCAYRAPPLPDASAELDFEMWKYESAGVEGGEIHAVRHLSDNLTTARLSTPRSLEYKWYSVTPQGDTSLRRPVVSSRCCTPLASFPRPRPRASYSRASYSCFRIRSLRRVDYRWRIYFISIFPRVINGRCAIDLFLPHLIVTLSMYVIVWRKRRGYS